MEAHIKRGSALMAAALLYAEVDELLPAKRMAHVTALAGGEALLPCDLSPANDSVALVLWYKDALPTPVYSVDARRGDVSQARHSSIAWGPRAYFATQPPGLRLQALAVGDSGVYRCRVDFRKDRTRNHETSLVVIEPPGKPVIREAGSDNREPLRSLIGPYNEGDSLSLVCDVEDGIPAPTVSWWRESVLLEGSVSEPRPGVRRNALGPFVLRRQDLMAVLACQTSNSNLTAPLSTSVTLDMNFRPLEVSVESVSRPLEAGKTGWLSCRAVGSRPRSRITWLLGDSALPGAKQNESLDGNVTLSLLALRPTAKHHGRLIRCRADNDLIPGSDIFAEFRLQVMFAPKLTLKLATSLRHSQLQEGQDVYLECAVEANPPVTEVRWWFGRRELFSNHTAGVLVNNRSLVLQRIQLNHKGPYSCSAVNAQGEGTSNTLHLNFQYAPVCRRGQKQVYGAASNQPVRVNCEVDAQPGASNFHWRLNNDTLTNFTWSGHSSQITVVPRLPADLGRLLCWATNQVGTQRKPCVFSISPARDPESPRNCSIHNRTATAFVVECEPGDDGGMPALFVLQVLDELNRTVLRANSSERPVWSVSGLSGGARLSLRLYALTAKGRSTVALLGARTLAGSQSLTEPLWPGSLSPLLVVLIACAVGLVSVAFLVTLLLRFRANKDRRKPSEPTKGDDEQQIAPLQQYPDGVLKLRSPQSEEKCPDVVLDVSGGSEERLKEEDDRPSEAVRWKGWSEQDLEHEKSMARSTLQEYQPKNGGQTRVKLVVDPASTPAGTAVPQPESASSPDLSECLPPPPLKYRQTIV